MENKPGGVSGPGVLEMMVHPVGRPPAETRDINSGRLSVAHADPGRDAVGTPRCYGHVHWE